MPINLLLDELARQWLNMVFGKVYPVSWPVVGGCPESELRQHLSERAPTDDGNHVYIPTQVIGMRQELGLIHSGAAQFAA